MAAAIFRGRRSTRRHLSADAEEWDIGITNRVAHASRPLAADGRLKARGRMSPCGDTKQLPSGGETGKIDGSPALSAGGYRRELSTLPLSRQSAESLAQTRCPMVPARFFAQTMSVVRLPVPTLARQVLIRSEERRSRRFSNSSCHNPEVLGVHLFLIFRLHHLLSVTYKINR
jgi:hypothetical protein